MSTSDNIFSRSDLVQEERAGRQRLLHDGRLFNARVYSVSIKGCEWTVKDFADRPFYVRAVARFLLRREVSILKRLSGIKGISNRVFRVDSAAMATEYLPGETLKRVDAKRITPDFLTKLEQLTATMHARGVVHLDLRSLTNVVIDREGNPGIIDFQSALSTKWMPPFLSRALRLIDMSGAAKKWLKFQPEAMGKARRALLDKANRVRRFWVFKGYFGFKRKRIAGN